MESSHARANAPDPRIGSLAAKRYRIIRLVGEGGMGRVYEALDEVRSTRVAIKTIADARARDRTALARFEREARTSASLVHPNIVEVFDVGHLEDRSPYIAMELLVGESLGACLVRDRTLSIRRAIEIALDVCAGLGAAHRKGVVHRDLTPENIFVASTGAGSSIAKILDFGISKLCVEPGARTLTTTGEPIGTPKYMAPEQIEGLGVDPRTDVYALGVVLYRALAGAEPFAGATPHLLAYRILAEDPPPIRRHRSDVPEPLERVVLRALAKRPDDRFESASAFAEALAPFASEAPDPGSEARAESSPPRFRARLAAPRRRVSRPTARGIVRLEWLLVASLFLSSFGASFTFSRRTHAPAISHAPRVIASRHARPEGALDPSTAALDAPRGEPSRLARRTEDPITSSTPSFAARTANATPRASRSSRAVSRTTPIADDGFIDEF